MSTLLVDALLMKFVRQQKVYHHLDQSWLHSNGKAKGRLVIDIISTPERKLGISLTHHA
jgi:hypothetical protein